MCQKLIGIPFCTELAVSHIEFHKYLVIFAHLKAVPDFPDTPKRKSGIRHRLEQLLAQVPDMTFHGIVLPSDRLIAPHVLIYLPISENLSSVHHQKIEKVIFLCRQAGLLAPTVYFPAARVDLQPQHLQYRIVIHLHIFKIRVTFQDFQHPHQKLSNPIH